jgi:hypothetical protein
MGGNNVFEHAFLIKVDVHARIVLAHSKTFDEA